jgi:hypothetical protein
MRTKEDNQQLELPHGEQTLNNTTNFHADDSLGPVIAIIRLQFKRKTRIITKEELLRYNPFI